MSDTLQLVGLESPNTQARPKPLMNLRQWSFLPTLSALDIEGEFEIGQDHERRFDSKEPGGGRSAFSQ